MRLTFAKLEGYQIFEAESADQALPLILYELPDIIVLDVMMPGEIDGFELCRIVKSWPECTNSKIILLSARSQEDDLEKGKVVGAEYYITKPFSPETLVNLVQKINLDL